MELFRRIRYTVSAGVGSFLDQVENQEAIATASIRQVEQMAARIRSAHRGSERQLQRLVEQQTRLQDEVARWQARAVRMKAEREKALECLRRRQTAERALRETGERLERQRAVCQSIARDEQALDARLAELRARCAELSSKQARHVALSDQAAPDALDALLDRWEARVGPRAPYECIGGDEDGFAQDLQREENDAALNAELEALLQTEEQGR